MSGQPEILVVGEALIDVVVNGDGGVTEHPGGSPANVALTLGRLGCRPRLLTWIGADARGRRIEAWLAESGVRVDPASRGSGPTSVATARLDASGAARYELDIRWDPGAPAPGPVDLLHVGSISAVLGAGAPLVRRLATSPASLARPLVSYDPNIRPGYLSDPETARRDVLALVRAADIVKVSDEDLAWIAQGQEPGRIVAGWLEDGAALVIVTRGADGAAAMTAVGGVEVAAPAVDVADTVGAGDTVMGAFLAALARTVMAGAAAHDPAAARRELSVLPLDDLQALLAYGVAAAAVTISRPGADPPWPDEIQGPRVTRRRGPR